MNLVLNKLRIPLEEDGGDSYRCAAAAKLGLDPGQIVIKEILSKALDLKDQGQFYYILSLVVQVPGQYPNRGKFARYLPPASENPTMGEVFCRGERPIVVGFGPAGMFAALELIALGQRPLIFERGQRIAERTIAVQKFIRERCLNPESNIQFGEGGAGSYSDGKLFSRRHNNTSTVNRVLKTFVRFGAPPEIEYIAKPHLGTDVLCRIVRNIRIYIQEQGGEIHYGAKMSDLLIDGGRAVGIVINGEKEYQASKIYIALGHSARDSFAMLYRRGVAMEQRRISVGLRIEHPVQTINRMRYGKKYENYPGLGAATYSLNYTNRKIRRGVYTFCMCPGGEVVNASSSPGRLVLNGMSYSQRASPFSNGALVVSCHRADYGSQDPLAGLRFQEEIERKAFEAGGGNWAVPAQNLMDFLVAQGSSSLNQNSCKMGVVPAEMREIFPEFVIAQLLEAFHKWRLEVPLFVARQAILLGPETRTSSPLRMLRDKHYQSVTINDLYPIGEGAGYTGGITSSAADGMKAVYGSQRR